MNVDHGVTVTAAADGASRIDSGHFECSTSLVPERRSSRRAALAWVLLGFCAVLLVSYGGAILAAPLSLPLLVFAARSAPSRTYRVVAGVVVVLTSAELLWAVTYLAVGEAKPAIWLVPILGTVVAVVAYAQLSRRPGARRTPTRSA
jgi:hypothetical protein